MSVLRKLAWVEVKLFFREPLALIIAFAFPFFMFFVLVGVFGNEADSDPEDIEVWRGGGPADYYVSTYVGLVMAAAGLVTLPLRIADYRERGVLRRYRAAGVSAPVMIGSQVLVASAMSVIAAIGIVVLSTTVYGTVLPESWPLVIAGSVVGLLTFAAFGVLLGAVVPSVRAAQGLGFSLFFVMLMISGSGPPREVLTSSMRMLSNVLPLTHVNLLLQDAWLGFGWSWDAALVATGFFVASGVLAARFFRWE